MAVQQQTAFPSAARTATPTSVILEAGDDARAAEVVIVTTASSVPSTTVNVEGQDDTGAWYVILVSAAITGNGTVRLLIGESVVPTANLAAQTVVPRLIRIRPVHGNANSHTYSVALRTR